MKKKDKFWDYAEELKGRFLCKFCQKHFPGGVARLKSHLSKQTGRDNAICEKVTEDVQAAALLAIGGVSAQSNKRKSQDFSSTSKEIIVVIDVDQSSSKLQQ
ncbi:hypothetical protein FRX31_023982 [Thalictrum thalictroides]|uniref:BED-type domain-containing protein n=1 Tax=Thalictrum thalictroides TaxID=46969 RepID=A0A7J6VQH2_THATH|nr:hypothetical protein FRX31_023982 [Thalictrum thalictroides]